MAIGNLGFCIIKYKGNHYFKRKLVTLEQEVLRKKFRFLDWIRIYNLIDFCILCMLHIKYKLCIYASHTVYTIHVIGMIILVVYYTLCYIECNQKRKKGK